jgi:glycosyltransferase involved in cell wall biosynthesis
LGEHLRPTISLACILKNEKENLPRLLASVKGCFDEIHLTDTGSTDGSIELIQSWIGSPNPAESDIHLHHFEWVHDFAKARNASFAPVKTDYVMWMDLDDVLETADKFIAWRDSVLMLADFWLAVYHYSTNTEGKAVCSFTRERIMRTNRGFTWKYFVHEGVMPNATDDKPVQAQFAGAWAIRHKRTEQDLANDKMRNLKIFEHHKNDMDPRMTYYYGKELFENGKALEAFAPLMTACAEEKMEPHDRILCLQYACMSSMQCQSYDKVIQLAHQGLQLMPNRAEFHLLIAESYLKMNRLQEALPYYAAAGECTLPPNSALVSSPLFHNEDAYTVIPRHQMARIYMHIGEVDKAEKMLKESEAYGVRPDTMAMQAELEKLKPVLSLKHRTHLAESDEIVISCHPQGLYQWDEEIAKTRGIGGSETAVVRMARELHKLTGRQIRVFNNREKMLDCGGVMYVPHKDGSEYFAKFLPKVHIAWRHAMKITEAPTYVWCHDLFAPGVEHAQNYREVLALSEFHRDYLHNLCTVPLDKIRVTRNGIDPQRFLGLTAWPKTPGKVVFSSSPDRGLARAIRVMDEVVKTVHNATLHVYYGFDNMKTFGKFKEVAEMEAMISARPWIHYHGNLQQDELAHELATAEVWLYPTDFLETHCITALEMMACRVYPVVRKWGALAHTCTQGTVLDLDCETSDQVWTYAGHVVQALKAKSWSQISIDPFQYSWESVAKEWVAWLPLSE